MESPGTGTGGGQEGRKEEERGRKKGRREEGKRREEMKKGRKTSITEINLPALIVKNNRILQIGRAHV